MPLHHTDLPYGTRPRALVAMAVGFVSLGVLHVLVGSSALAVNFTTADKQFKIYSNYVQGVYGAGYLSQNDGRSAASQGGVAELGFKTAKLAGLCAIAHETLPGGIGDVSFVITAGVPVRASFDSSSLITTDGAGQPITTDANGFLTGQSAATAIDVTDMYLNTTALSGYGNKISGLNLGQDAGSVGAASNLTWPNASGGSPPVPGKFGLFSHFLNISGLDGGSYGVNLNGQVALSGLRMKILPGLRTQADCPTQAATP